jgi:hypothetical protein
VASAWHWTWERRGAAQLNQRINRIAERRMKDTDYAAWAAVRSIVDALVRTQSREIAMLRAYLTDEAFIFDTYKGRPDGYNGASIRRAASSAPKPRRSCATDDRPGPHLRGRTHRKDALADLQAHPSSPRSSGQSFTTKESQQPEPNKALLQQTQLFPEIPHNFVTACRVDSCASSRHHSISKNIRAANILEALAVG